MDNIKLINTTASSDGDNTGSSTNPDGAVYFEDMESCTNGAVPSGWSSSEILETNKTEYTTDINSTVWKLWTQTVNEVTLSYTVADQPAGNYKVSVDVGGNQDGTVLGTLSLSAGDNKKSADLEIGAWSSYATTTVGFLTIEDTSDITLEIKFTLAGSNRWANLDNITLTAVSDDDVQADKIEKLTALNTLITACEALSNEEYSEESTDFE